MCIFTIRYTNPRLAPKISLEFLLDVFEKKRIQLLSF